MIKFRSFIMLIAISVLLLPLSSCMHAMMMGGHDNHSDHQSMTIAKEVVNGDNTLSVSIPPMTVEKEGTITITLRSKSSLPESVSVHYMISKNSSTENSSKHNHGKQTGSEEEFKTIHQNILMNNGASTITYIPSVAGSFVLTVEIEKVPNSDSSLSAETNFMVHEKESNEIMSMGGMWDYPVIGVIVMGTVMFSMWAIRGGF
jgi:hypothetical protein